MSVYQIYFVTCKFSAHTQTFFSPFILPFTKKMALSRNSIRLEVLNMSQKHFSTWENPNLAEIPAIEFILMVLWCHKIRKPELFQLSGMAAMAATERRRLQQSPQVHSAF